MNETKASTLADALAASGWTSAHVEEIGKDDYAVRVDIPENIGLRLAARAIYVDAYPAFGGNVAWSASAYDGKAIKPTETLVTYDIRGVDDALAALRGRQQTMTPAEWVDR